MLCKQWFVCERGFTCYRVSLRCGVWVYESAIGASLFPCYFPYVHQLFLKNSRDFWRHPKAPMLCSRPFQKTPPSTQFLNMRSMWRFSRQSAVEALEKLLDTHLRTAYSWSPPVDVSSPAFYVKVTSTSQLLRRWVTFFYRENSKLQPKYN